MFKNVWTSVMGAKCLGQLLTSTSDEKHEEARAFILADRRNRITTRRQSRYGLCFIAWHSWVSQSFCKVGAQTSDRRV